MGNTKNPPVPVIQLFAKPPVAGRVKTRLIPDLGQSLATDIYRYCLDYALRLVRQTNIDYQIWLSEDSHDPLFIGELYHLQQGADLGSRMLSAIQSQLQHGTTEACAVILIGSDCLDLTPAHLQQAIDSLVSDDLVLLPTFDGGYALIGCRRIDTRLFANVEWGGNQVLQQTLGNAQSLNYRVSVLETVRDIDTLQDVNHYAELMSLITSS
jgi:rSAM/selenodomain-associated transferase 1